MVELGMFGTRGRLGAPPLLVASFLAFLLLAAGGTAAPAAAAATLAKAAPKEATLTQAGRGTVTKVVDGDTLILALDPKLSTAFSAEGAAVHAPDGTGGGAPNGTRADIAENAGGGARKGPGPATVSVRLVGIQAPKLPLERPNFAPWPLADAAKAALERLTLGREITLSFGGRRVDRYGRLLAQLHDRDGLWIQGEMLRRGLARVYSFADNRALVAEMLTLEQAARTARRGIWANPYYRVLRPEEAGRHIGSFQLVAGRVRSAAVVRGRGYLNFGADWRTDFTIAIAPRARRLFEAAGISIEGLAGRRLRVRGWIKSFNGPMIDATHPEQIEVLEK